MLQLNNVGIRIKDNNILCPISISFLEGAFVVISSSEYEDILSTIKTIEYKDNLKSGIIYYNEKKIGFLNKNKYRNNIFMFKDYINGNLDKTVSEIFNLYAEIFSLDLQPIALSYFSFIEKAHCKISELSDSEKIFVNAAQLFFTKKNLWIINEHIGDLNILDKNDFEKLVGLFAVKCDNGGIIIFSDYKGNSKNIPFGIKLNIDDFKVLKDKNG